MFDNGIMHQAFRRVRVVTKVGSGLVLVAGLVACGASKSPEQLIVKGDKFEVTLQEYEQLLEQMPPVTKAAVAPMRRMLLQRLIDEKLLAEAAVAAGMQDDPGTSQAIAAAKRGILAQAYLRNMTGKLPKADPRAVETYYQSHPAKFAERRRFIVEEYVLRSDLPDLRDYADAFNKGTFDTLTALISDRMPDLHPAVVVRFSDELPDSRDTVLDALTAGSNIAYQSPGQVHLGRIQAVSVEPLALDAAKPGIEQSLAASRALEIQQAAVKDLRKSRNVEILNASLKKATADTVQKAPTS